jgi:hypothetical protein
MLQTDIECISKESFIMSFDFRGIILIFINNYLKSFKNELFSEQSL